VAGAGTEGGGALEQPLINNAPINKTARVASANFFMRFLLS
jgi:hypothetical protein